MGVCSQMEELTLDGSRAGQCQQQKEDIAMGLEVVSGNFSLLYFCFLSETRGNFIS